MSGKTESVVFMCITATVNRSLGTVEVCIRGMDPFIT